VESLDNVIWRSLTGAQASFAIGSGGTRRFAPSFSALVGFAQPQEPDWSALEPLCLPGDHVYCMDWSGAAPDDWVIEQEATMWRMLWDAPTPTLEPVPGELALDATHAGQALELARLTNPGPFGTQTLQMGDFFGYLDEGRLVSMAGERMQIGNFREVTAVCTHPDFRGRGLARRLTLRMVQHQLERGQRPFLHVMTSNTRAVELYRSLGFRNLRELVVRAIGRRP